MYNPVMNNPMNNRCNNLVNEAIKNEAIKNVKTNIENIEMKHNETIHNETTHIELQPLSNNTQIFFQNDINKKILNSTRIIHEEILQNNIATSSNLASIYEIRNDIYDIKEQLNKININIELLLLKHDKPIENMQSAITSKKFEAIHPIPVKTPLKRSLSNKSIK